MTSLAPAERRRSLGALMMHMFGIGPTLGSTMPLVSLTLEGRGSGARATAV